MANKKKEKHKGYRITIGVISIVLSSCILLVSTTDSDYAFLSFVVGALGIASGILELNADKNSGHYLVSGILLYVAAFANISFIGELSLFSIYALIIGGFNFAYSKEK